MSSQQIIRGTSIVNGTATAKLLACDVELSFWGGVDAQTGEVIDRFHPLSGHLLKDTILAIPAGRGSCGGSAQMLELIMNGLGPKALVFQRPDEIITLGVLVAQEFFDKSAPVVVLELEEWQKVYSWSGQKVYVVDGQISTAVIEQRNDAATASSTSEASLRLSDFDQKALDGDYGEATRTSMKITVRMAEMMGATELMDVTQAHVDAAWYGPASVAYGEKLRDLGGKFRVPTTLNSINIDQRQWKALGVDEHFSNICNSLAEAFLNMGAQPTLTCAPYMLRTAPKLRERVGWSESNAAIYVNSVLGARSLKYPILLDTLVAITGRAPAIGVYLNEERYATLQIKVPGLVAVDDGFWPVFGYTAGVLAAQHIPVITGVAHLKPSKDDLKAFSAAFATSSSAPMFHIVGVTPEASTLTAACKNGVVPPTVDLKRSSLNTCWQEFNSTSFPVQVDLVSLGNPHASLKEIKALAELCRGRTKSEDVTFIVTCGRSHHGLASQAGYVKELEDFGIQFLTDTCWCQIRDPIIPNLAKVIMTNSGKYVHYGPGLTGRKFCFGSLASCVEAACLGWYEGKAPAWLEEAESESTQPR